MKFAIRDDDTNFFGKKLKMIKNIFHSETKKILLENFLSLSFLQVANYVFPIITLPYLVRVLKPEKYGLVAFAQAFIGYFMILTDYGFNLSAPREVSINRDNKQKLSEIFSSVMIIKFFLMILSLLILTLIVVMFKKFRQDYFLYYLTFGMVVGNIMFPQWFFQGIENMKFITVLNLLAKIIFTISIFIFVRKQTDYYFVPLLNSLGFITAGILSLWIVFKNFKIKFSIPSIQQIFYQLKEGWYIFISTVAISLYTISRIFLVGVLTDNTITGYYAIAEKLMNIFQTFPLASFLQAIYPRLSKMYKENVIKAFEWMKKLQNITTIIYFFFCIILILFADLIVLVVAGEKYRETILAFRLLIIAVFFINANAFRVQFLLVSERDKLYSKLHIIMGIIGLILIFILTFIFNYIGAAISIIFVESIVFIYCTLLLNRETKSLEHIKNEPQI